MNQDITKVGAGAEYSAHTASAMAFVGNMGKSHRVHKVVDHNLVNFVAMKGCRGVLLSDFCGGYFGKITSPRAQCTEADREGRCKELIIRESCNAGDFIIVLRQKRERRKRARHLFLTASYFQKSWSKAIDRKHGEML